MSQHPSHRDAADIAAQVAAEAADLLRGGAGAVGTIRTKSNLKDLVTEWDTRAEALIRDRLETLAPGIPILGEEGGVTGADPDADPAGPWWLVDPLDGTVNFAHGVPLFAVSIALEIDGEPVAGCVAAPALGWQFVAHLGGGATMNGEPISVSSVDQIGEAMLVSGFPYDRAETRHNFAEWEHFQCKAGACRRLGAAALDLALVARGAFDGYWESRLNPWDLSAGALLVREAGGVVTSITGGPFRSRSGDAIASNGAIHNVMVTELDAVRSRKRP